MIPQQGYKVIKIMINLKYVQSGGKHQGPVVQKPTKLIQG